MDWRNVERLIKAGTYLGVVIIATLVMEFLYERSMPAFLAVFFTAWAAVLWEIYSKHKDRDK